ncbi:MAG: hypothetical protein KAW41_07080 [Candidatus Diapherotrites archaeon]|nr:hypothetical protein [Candidatus Diapherotrites archaeon]
MPKVRIGGLGLAKLVEKLKELQKEQEELGLHIEEEKENAEEYMDIAYNDAVKNPTEGKRKLAGTGAKFWIDGKKPVPRSKFRKAFIAQLVTRAKPGKDISKYAKASSAFTKKKTGQQFTDEQEKENLGEFNRIVNYFRAVERRRQVKKELKRVKSEIRRKGKTGTGKPKQKKPREKKAEEFDPGAELLALDGLLKAAEGKREEVEGLAAKLEAKAKESREKHEQVKKELLADIRKWGMRQELIEQLEEEFNELTMDPLYPKIRGVRLDLKKGIIPSEEDLMRVVGHAPSVKRRKPGSFGEDGFPFLSEHGDNFLSLVTRRLKANKHKEDAERLLKKSRELREKHQERVDMLKKRRKGLRETLKA